MARNARDEILSREVRTKKRADLSAGRCADDQIGVTRIPEEPVVQRLDDARVIRVPDRPARTENETNSLPLRSRARLLHAGKCRTRGRSRNLVHTKTAVLLVEL